MKTLTNLLGDHVISALGWSLFHILWQGFLLAFIIGISLYMFRKKSAQIRYLISVASLLLIVGLSVFNFYNNYKPDLNTNLNYTNTETIDNTKSGKIINISNYNVDISYNELFKRTNNYLEKIDVYFPLIVNIWMLGVFVFILKFILSYLYTNRLKRKKSNQLPEKWINKFSELEQKLKLKQRINYIESTIAKIPFVLGYFKPVVVIPVEMLTGMPSNQMEAIIAHELAHIRRNDYIINVLQTIIETVFFFHPALWYISSQIRKERENCCDDIAITVCEGSLIYAKALVSVQELTLKKHYAAVAFSGKKKHLLNRIKRMIMKPKIKTNITDKIIASLIILSGIFALSFTYSAEITNYESESILLKEKEIPIIEEQVVKTPIKTVHNKPIEIAKRDTIHFHQDYDHNETIDIEDNTVIKTFKENGKKIEMKFTLKNGKATDLFVDGKEVLEKDYDKYKPEIDKTIKDLKNAKKDIRRAMIDIENMDFEGMQEEIHESMKDFHVDVEKMQKEVAVAMEEMENIDIDEIMKNVEKQMQHLEEIDFDFDFEMEDIHVDLDKIKIEMEKAHKEMIENIDMEEVREEIERVRESIKENVDMESIQKELEQVRLEITNIDKEKIKLEMEESIKEIEKIDKKEITKDLEQKLEELENLELEEK